MAKGGQSGKASGGPGREALRLLESGDVWAARLLARQVVGAGEGGNPEDLSAAREVLSRTAFPREALKVGALAATLIAVLIVLAILRG